MIIPKLIEIKRNKYFLLILILLNNMTLWAQLTNSLGTESVTELECVQSKITSTFVASSMEYVSTHPTGWNNERVLIHRSTDYGSTWTLIDSIEILPGEICIGDPVVAVDNSGNFYLVVMRVHSAFPSPFIVDLELYNSVDDGKTWSFVSKPYISNTDFWSDYPQIIARGSGELYLTFSLYKSTRESDSKVIFQKSVDEGLSWSNIHEFSIPEGEQVIMGSDISWGSDEKLHLTYAGVSNSQIYHFHSLDYGLNWSEISISSIGVTAANITKPISHINFDYFGVLSHKPHNVNTPITYHSFMDGNWQSLTLANGAYAQGLITNDGIIHLIYNQRVDNNFLIKYVSSVDKGQNFSNPIVLYSSDFTNDGDGEYQSLFIGTDGKCYLTFCDWGDDSRAKLLVFPPYTLGTEEYEEDDILIYPNPATEILTIELTNSSITKSVKLLNIYGTLIKEIPIENSQMKYEFNISKIPVGYYIVLVEEDTRFIVKNVLKH